MTTNEKARVDHPGDHVGPRHRAGGDRALMRVLVTGGRGFVGSHVVDALLDQGPDVVVLDPLVAHEGEAPEWTRPEARLVVGDVRYPDAWTEAATGVDAVCHQAARVVAAGPHCVVGVAHVATRSAGSVRKWNVAGRAPTRMIRLAGVETPLCRLAFGSRGGNPYETANLGPTTPRHRSESTTVPT